MRSFALVSFLAAAVEATGIVTQIGDGQIQAPAYYSAPVAGSVVASPAVSVAPAIPAYGSVVVSSSVVTLFVATSSSYIAPSSSAVVVSNVLASSHVVPLVYPSAPSTSIAVLPAVTTKTHKPHTSVVTPLALASSVNAPASAASTVACAVSQIVDGQPQAPAGCSVASTSSAVALAVGTSKVVTTSKVVNTRLITPTSVITAPYPIGNASVAVAGTLGTIAATTVAPTSAIGTAAPLSTATGAASMVTFSYFVALTAALAFFA